MNAATLDPLVVEEVALDGPQVVGDDGFVLVNSARDAAGLGIEAIASRLPEGHVATVAATELAVRHLGRPTPNTVLLGALTARGCRLGRVAGSLSGAPVSARGRPAKSFTAQVNATA